MAERSILRRLFRGSDTPADAPPTEERAEPAPVAQAPPPKRSSWLQRLKSGLARSSNALSEGIVSVLSKRRIDAEALDDFEDFLLKTDLGLEVAAAVTERLRG